MAIIHECQRSTACCRWPGDVRLGDGEMARLATLTGMNEEEFIQRFARLSCDRRGLSLEEGPDGSCIFLDGNACAVHPVRPQPCGAIPRPVSAEEYKRLILAATGRQVSVPEE